MAQDPFSVHPFYNAMIRAQSAMLEAQAPFWEQMAGATPPSGADEALKAAEGIWADARARGQDMFNRMTRELGMAGKGEEGIAQETLQRMLDPGQFLYAGSDEINQTIQKLVEGPEFADIGTLEKGALKATQEWLALREASTEYRFVTAKAWMRAFERYSRETLADRELWQSGTRALLDRWLEVANDELIATQRTEAFLAAQRKLLRAGVDYRLRSRELVETWCETHSIPTRTEIDDLHEMVHRLRREVRDIKKQLAQGQDGAGPEREGGKRRTSAKRGEPK